jgi:UDP-N-acetylmuramoylalanine--D-glutamate ligase
MQGYIDDKLKPLAQMRVTDIAIVPDAYKNTPTKAKLISYKGEEDLAKIFEINANRVHFKGAFLADALLAMAVDKLLFGRIDYKKMNEFKLDSHRQEELRDFKNRLWVNDTKATNLDATIAAVKRYKDSFIHLILGGDDKGVDLSELFEYLKTVDLKIYAIGSNKDKLVLLAQNYNIAYVQCKNLANAIEEIDKNHKSGEVALLSPAAASLDEFSSYAQRGNEFKSAVENIC